MPAAGPELVRAVREQAGLDLVSLVPAGGESGAAFWARERGGGTWMLKIAELLAALRRIGENCGPAVPLGVDFTHFDFHFMNLLSNGRAITGVVDVNPPPVSGDRAFDLATLAFYVYDVTALRRPILARLSGLASRPAVRAYLAHMVLRQVEWSVRHYPAAPATRHHLRLARLIVGDIGDDDPGPDHGVPR